MGADADNNQTTTVLSRVERAQLCDLFDETGPSAPTLCAGWDTHHLAAHLWGREANPLRSAVAAVPKLGDRSVEQIMSRHSYDELVMRVRTGPPRFSLYGIGKLEATLNGIEFFVHHEDVRRAVPGWKARALPAESVEQLWPMLKGAAKLAQRRARAALSLERSDTGESVQVSKGPSGSPHHVTVRGLPGELTMYALGRYKAASVDFVGTPEAIAALTGKPTKQS